MSKRSIILVFLMLGVLVVPTTRKLTGKMLRFSETREWEVQGEARRVTAIGWNGEYWLIGTSDGWIVRLDGSNFSVVGRVDIEGVHSHIIWTGKYWLGTSGVYYCSAFAYDGEKLVELRYRSFNEIVKVSYASDKCVLVNQVPYSDNFSILTWNGESINVLVEDAIDLLSCKSNFNYGYMQLRLELVSNGSSCLIYLCSEPSATHKLLPVLQGKLCHKLYSYDGQKLVNLSWSLPKKAFLWRLPIPQGQPYIWKEISNGTHWLSFSSDGKLLFFNGREFQEVKVDANLSQYWEEVRSNWGPEWKGDYWRMHWNWNGEYWLISYIRLISNIPAEACLLKYDGKRVELVKPPRGLSIINFRKSRWPVNIGQVVWGDGRWLIAANKRSSFWSRRWGYLFSFDGENFEDLMPELNEAIVLAGGGPGRPRPLLQDIRLLAVIIGFLGLSIAYLMICRSLSPSK